MLKKIKKILYFIVLFLIISIILGKFFNPPITFTQIGGLFRYHKLQRDYISYDEMGVNVKKAVIASEDQNFFKHHGFDFEQIQKAIENKNKGKRLRGASTISQQTAKNVFLWNGGGFFRKIPEAAFTVVIEFVWGKKTILERYLNTIEMGQGVFGVEAAAGYYFGKSAKNLTKSEAAWIAVTLPSPKKYDPKNPSAYLQRRHAWVMRQMNYMVLE